MGFCCATSPVLASAIRTRKWPASKVFVGFNGNMSDQVMTVRCGNFFGLVGDARVYVEVMQTIRVTALIAFGLATPAMAASYRPWGISRCLGSSPRLQGELSKCTLKRRKSGICRLPRNAGLKFRSSGIAHEHHLPELRGFAEPRDVA